MMLVYSTTLKGCEKNMKNNTDIRNLIRVSGFYSYQVASKLSMHENSLYRMLRKDLNDQEKKRIFDALDQLKVERDEELLKMNNAETKAL